MIRGDVGALLHVTRCERFDVAAERFEVLGVLVDEFLVVEPFIENDSNHSGQHRGIFPGNRLKVEDRLLRGFGPPRIDHDELDAALDRAMQVIVGVEGRDPAETGDRRVGSNEKPCVGSCKGRASAVPSTVQSLGEEFPGLIDRATAE